MMLMLVTLNIQEKKIFLCYFNIPTNKSVQSNCFTVIMLNSHWSISRKQDKSLLSTMGVK